MFSKLVARNSRRNLKDNVLYFSSMVISIVAFYIVLSLSNQDVMIFLKKMESEAVGRLMRLVPIFYLLSLFILFFLVYFAGSIQIERRRHEFGVYLTLGMNRRRLFAMILLEELRNSLLALALGVPVAVLLSELISLVTAKVVGLGIIGHHFSFSLDAVMFTILGFLLVKLISCICLSLKVAHKEIGDLLSEAPDEMKPQLPRIVYIGALIVGLLLLVKAYQLGISGASWQQLETMGLMVLLGVFGTIFLFFGLRIVIGFLVKMGGQNRRELHAFNFRQIQTLVISRSTTVAICSLLILLALCMFGAGMTYTLDRSAGIHLLDYTFTGEDWKHPLDTKQMEELLQKEGLAGRFSQIVELRTGMAQETDALSLDGLIEEISKAEATESVNTLLHNLEERKGCYFIPLSSYNELRKLAKLEPLDIKGQEAVLYMSPDLVSNEELLNATLAKQPAVQQSGQTLKLVGQVESLPLVTDRTISLAFALIVPDSAFTAYVGANAEAYVSAVLQPDLVRENGLMQVIMETNKLLDQLPVHYESYLQNMGRQWFFAVAAGYLTTYLAIIFLVVANTTIGVQFLMGQRKMQRRYRILIHMGATYQTLCRSARKQINWYFGLPLVIALSSSIFGVMTLFRGSMPSSRLNSSLGMQLLVAGLAMLGLALVEYIYITLVKKSSDRFLGTLMRPKRIE